MVLTQEQIKVIVQDYFKDKPVKRVYLFGSYAVGSARAHSDIDLLVDLDFSQRVGMGFYCWHEELGEIFHQKVDVVPNADKPEHTTNWKFIQHINQNKVLLYEKG
jgi:uncharacterized protein